jgi:hypothetical protein
MFTKLKTKYRKFEDWFDIRFGWFFTNGNKVDKRNERLREKFNIPREQD